MRVFLYKGKIDIEKSGVGKAVKHQEKALTLAKVPYTLNEKDEWDIIHINTIFPTSLVMANIAKSKGKKVIIHAHSTEEDIKNSFLFSNMAAPALKQWLKILYNKADSIKQAGISIILINSGFSLFNKDLILSRNCNNVYHLH